MNFRIMLFVLLVAASACSQTDKPADSFTRMIHTPEMTELMKNTSDLVIIDVRTADEVAMGQIPGAIHVDLYDPGFDEKISRINRNTRSSFIALQACAV
ncbi:MAG: rhodanese-like domain-containing protein, partial [Cyclobacteriaceae bacterium]